MPKIFFLDSIIFPKKSLGIWPFKIYLLQTPPAPSAPPAPPAPPASHAQTGEAKAYILICIPDYGCFRWDQQLLGQKPRIFVCSELLWALESNETSFPFWESAYPPKHVTCTVSRVTCHVSRVTCHLSPVIFLKHFLYFFYIILQNNWQSGGASWWTVCYQRGVPV